MTNRKKRNLAVGMVLFLLVIPLYFMTLKMEETLAKKETHKNTQRSPAVQDASTLNMKE